MHRHMTSFAALIVVLSSVHSVHAKLGRMPWGSFLHEKDFMRTEEISHVDYSECSYARSASKCALKDLTGPTMIAPGGKARCAFNTDANYDTNQEYFFQVVPGKGADRNKVLLHFQDGGACISEETCDFSLTRFVSLTGEDIFYSSILPIFHGIWNFRNENNPFKHWTLVAVNYCSGDAHMGNAVVNANKDMPTYLNGINNAEAVVKWMFTNVDVPDQFVLSGASAGALGAVVWAPRILTQWTQRGVSADDMVVFLDSYPGVFPHETNELFDFWQICDERLAFSPALMTKCKAHRLTFPEVAAHAQEMFRTVPFAYITSKLDLVQRLFYCLIKYRKEFVVSGFQARACLSQQDFYQGLDALLGSFTTKTRENNVISYVMNSDDHVFLTYDYLFDVNTQGLGWKYHLDALPDAREGYQPSLIEWMVSLTRHQGKRQIDSQCLSAYDKNTSYSYDCHDGMEYASFVGSQLRLEDLPRDTQTYTSHAFSFGPATQTVEHMFRFLVIFFSTTSMITFVASESGII